MILATGGIDRTVSWGEMTHLDPGVGKNLEPPPPQSRSGVGAWIGAEDKSPDPRWESHFPLWLSGIPKGVILLTIQHAN